MRSLLVGFSLLLAACGVSSTAQQPAPPPSNDPGLPGVFAQIPDIYQEVQPSVVAIFAGPGEGSGVIWDADGIIVTNNHVVAGLDEVEVALATGERLAGRVRARDPQTDLAIVEVDRDGLPPAAFTEAPPRIGELAIALGNPLGFEGSVTAGIISGVNRYIPGAALLGEGALVDLIQTDAAISPGNSGGALVNARGQVMGINIAYIPPQARAVSIGFAVPSATVVYVVTQLLETGAVEHSFLGIQPDPVTPQISQRFGIPAPGGVLVTLVVPSSPAAAAGIEEGDVIVSAEGERLESVEELFGELRRHRPGDEITLGLLRNGDEVQIPVTLGERPPSG